MLKPLEKYSSESREISEHPLAEPVVRYLDNSGIKSDLSVSDVESITGKGIKATIENKSYYVGNRKMMDDNNIQD